MTNQLRVFFVLLRQTGFRRFLQKLAVVFSLVWLVVEPAAFFFPDKINFGIAGYVALTVVSIIVGLWLSWPRFTIASKVSGADVIIRIKVGNLFHEKSHLVIGTNDVFDTDLSNGVISRNSVQGQFEQEIYEGDLVRLDEDLKRALAQETNVTQDLNKKLGKNLRYPVGTTAVLNRGQKMFFLVAYCVMSETCMASSDANKLWLSLSKLWSIVREKGELKPVATPVLGSGFGRTNLTRRLLAQLIITSFIVATREKFVARELTLMIHPNDLADVNLYDLEDFLVSVTT